MTEHHRFPTPSDALPSSSPGSAAPLIDQPSAELESATGFVGMHGTLMTLAGDRTGESSRAQSTLTSMNVKPGDSLQISSGLVKEGVTVLETFISLQHRTRTLLRYCLLEVCEMMFNAPIAGVVADGNQIAIGGLTGDTSKAMLLDTSMAIFQASTQTLVFPASPAGGALITACATPTVRWDIIGIHLGSLGIILTSDGLFDNYSACYEAERSERSLLAVEAFHACMQCHAFGERLGQVNDLTIWLLVTALTLGTWCFGDDSYRAWQTMGALSTAFLAMNLHKASIAPQRYPEYVLELRRRAIGKVHEADKSMATFVSRPPRISRHFCSMEMPLDVSDSDLMGSPEALRAAKSQLDENGWNKEGRIHRSFRDRAHLLLCVYREEALELSFGRPVPDLGERVSHVLTGLNSTWHSISRMGMISIDQPSSKTTPQWSTFLWTRLDYLYTSFLCLKLLFKSSEEYRAQFVETSHTILDLILGAMKSRIWFLTHRYDAEWVTITYAMPCATVLLLELSRRLRHPRPTVGLDNAAMIKEISALILCCDWLVEDAQGNQQTIKQAQSLLSKGLDQILSFLGSAAQGNVELPASDSPLSQNSVAAATDGGMNAFIGDPCWATWLEPLDLDQAF